MQASAVSGVRSDGFQITGSPQTKRERGVPAPHRDREVEGADDRDGAERMPRLREPVAGTLGRDRAAVELAREADGEVADVDHLLHLAEPLLRDLPDLERHERAERLLLAAQLLAEQPHELAAMRAGQVAPGDERLGGAGDRPRRSRPRRCRATRAISSPVIGVRTTRSPSRDRRAGSTPRRCEQCRLRRSSTTATAAVSCPLVSTACLPRHAVHADR